MKHETCTNAIFDPIWGEYKCRVLERRIRSRYDCMECKDYKEGKPERSKVEYEVEEE